MNKLNGESLNIVNDNIEKLKELFPEVFSEGKINFTKLEEELGEFTDKENERYNFTWNGKQEAKKIAQTPSTGTLRPCEEESKDWDTTQNLYIEGDNLEVLKLLQKSYHKKVKMIYIDPPYNTGKDFVYKDNFKDNIKNYLEQTGQVDSEGNRLSTNSDTSGRYHSDWLSMMYPRLKLARNLLKDDGVVFISLDDNEIKNLKNLCDEIFGEDNFISQLVVVNNIAGRSDKKHIATAHEYILMYQKSEEFDSTGLPLSIEQMKDYNKIDEQGKKYREQGLRKRGSGSKRQDRPNMFYSVFYDKSSQKISLNESDLNEAIEIIPKLSTGEEGRWRWGRDTFIKKQHLLGIKKVAHRNEYDVYEKVYLEQDGVEKTTKMKSFLLDSRYTTDTATSFLSKIIEPKIFESPKPFQLIEDLLRITNDKNALVIDFFSGSGTIAHSVMQLNSEDNGNRKFICVQIPEETDEKSEAYKAGYNNICEIGKERIRRAGEKIKEDNQDNQDKDLSNLDIGFKVFKLDSSNIKEWDSDFENLEQTLEDSVENIKSDRTGEDLLYEILLKYGLDLTLPIEEKTIDGKKVFIIGFGALVVCLDDDITTDIVEAIAKLKEEYETETMRVVFKDSSFKNAVIKTNAIQILKQFDIDEVVSV